MNSSHLLSICTFSRCLLILLLALLPTTASVGQSYQNQWPQYQRPYSRGPYYSTYPPQYQTHRSDPIHRQPIPSNVPSGSTTRVLSDGRIAIITPFTEEQKREIKQREDERLRQREKRIQEQAGTGNNSSLFPRLPGEFEKPKAILLSLCDWQPHNFDVLIELLEQTRGHAGLLLLYNDEADSNGQPLFPELIKRLLANGKDYPHIRFLRSNLDTIWLRDFGPRFAETEDGNAMVMDFFYDIIRPRDDEFPKTWADRTKASHNLVPWSLQGGNLLANGRGLAVITSRLFEDNRINRPGKDYLQNEAYVKRQLMDFCNIKELVVLKPLEQESTRHVDMFATILAPDLILVAQLDPRLDPVNAKILDDNAKLLSQTKVEGKPLRVERIWIPPRRHQHWSAYTNIILTDRLVLIPTYQTDPPAYTREAVNTYRRILPRHHVTTIDMTQMDKLGGALHCLSCSIPSFAKFPPGMQTFREATTNPVSKLEMGN